MNHQDYSVKGPLPFIFMLVICTMLSACATTGHYAQRRDVQAFITHMTTHDGFTRQQVADTLAQARYQPQVLRSMQKPHEGSAWFKYRSIFLSPERAHEGAEFWQRNLATLTRAEQEYGVPPEIISAIIGVETRYGRFEGTYRVLDALTTLAFDYPPRAHFFQSELMEYLLLTREEHFDPFMLQGSYAGAMGEPQFMPSSYRHYAVDYDHDGKRDLFHDETDVIGSIAYYFKAHGWEQGKAITIPARLINPQSDNLANHGSKPVGSLKLWAERGVLPKHKVTLSTQEKAALLRLQGEEGPEYWLTFTNFYVITRYNTSPAYAMAVYQLSQMIKKCYQGMESTE
jgi:membrane-bound lytic murein transglycosylase B